MGSETGVEGALKRQGVDVRHVGIQCYLRTFDFHAQMEHRKSIG